MRGKNAEYSSEFESAWKQYGRKEEKGSAYPVWKRMASEAGGEGALLGLVLGALSWQAPLFGQEGWKYAPYFERYLKHRKWADQPPPAAAGVPEKFRQSRAAAAGWLARHEGNGE